MFGWKAWFGRFDSYELQIHYCLISILINQQGSIHTIFNKFFRELVTDKAMIGPGSDKKKHVSCETFPARRLRMTMIFDHENRLNLSLMD